MCKRNEETFHWRIYRWQTSTLEKCKLKPQYIITYLSEGLNKKTGTPSAGEDVEKLVLHTLLTGMKNGAETLGKSSAVSYETKHATVM